MAGGKEILFVDKDITVYAAAGKERMCSDGKHLIAVINQHAERIYDLVSYWEPPAHHIQRSDMFVALGCTLCGVVADSHRAQQTSLFSLTFSIPATAYFLLLCR
jgi:hypothetical protein